MSPIKVQNLQNYESMNNICEGDCCIGAVQRAYREMLQSGQAEVLAFDTALTVFSWHHPEVACDHAEILVRGWVDEAVCH